MATKTAPKQSAKASGSKPAKTGIQITGEGKYPLVPLEQIEIVERPKPGDETKKLFFNPRDLASFTPQSMAELRLSIRLDGLQTPPLVRAFTDDGVVNRVELVAGERRTRSLKHIVDNDLPCFDEDAPRPDKYKPGQVVVAKGHFGKVLSHAEQVTVQLLEGDADLTEVKRSFAPDDVYPTVPGSALYECIPCRVAYDINDAKALRLAFTENDKSESLSTKEEIALVERLVRMEMKVAEIAEMLGSNETWVSQTANFRTALPTSALERLLDGTMKRHVAVKIMGFKPADREKLFKATVEAEATETAAKIEDADDEVVKAEDDELLALDDAKKAEKAGDTKTANAARRRASSSSTKAEKAREKKDRAISEAGQIRTGHVQKAASQSNIAPKKAQMLPKEEIETRYVKGMVDYLSGDETDPVCKEEVPGDLAAIVRLTAMAILQGNHDPLSVIRQYMVEQERWSVDGGVATEDDEDNDEDDDGEQAYGGGDDEDIEPSDDELEALDDEDSGDDDDEIIPRRGRSRVESFDADQFDREWN